MIEKNHLKNKKLVLAIIILVGISLRFYKLDSQCLWYDETTKIASAKCQYTIKEFFQHADPKEVVYTLVLKIWMNIFGFNEFAVRSLSVLFGVLSIFFIYILASELFSETVGLISSFLLSISPFHIYYSQQNLLYSLFLLLAILSTLIFVRVYNTNKKFLYLAYFIVNILLCYTHFFGLHILLIHNACLFFFKKSDFFKKKWLIINALLIILVGFFIFAILYMEPRPNQIGQLDWISKPNFGLIIDTLKAFTYGGEKLTMGGNGLEIGAGRLTIAKLLILIYALLLMKAGLSYKNFIVHKGTLGNSIPFKKQKIIFLFSWLVIPVLLTFVFSFLFFPIYVVRYLIIIIPAFFILLAIGILNIKGLKTKLFVFFLILIFNSQALFVYFHPIETPSWREISSKIKEMVAPEDMLVFVPLEQIVSFAYYFFDRTDTSIWDIDRYGKKIDTKWKSFFRENDYIFAGVGLRNSPDDTINGHLFKISERKANKIFLIASPYWPTLGLRFLAVRQYFLKGGWKEKGFFYPLPGVALLIYTK
ncbi:MAG: glycosyltransferase family 39 protein [Candidatus Omnitrophica bacterium]|nr:glycosyltransferase family 39 protein [Candidatus Omnitrophota bacterium]